MKLFILSFALAAVLVSARKLGPQELQASFKETLNKFQPEKALTFLRSGSKDEHFRSFCKFAQAVQDHNTNHGEHWLGELNAFAVMTESERQQYLGLNVSSLVVERREPHKPRVLEKRADKVKADYREHLPAIKNQGSCGSCWAFGAVAALEYQLNRRRTSINPVALSEQQYLDCVKESSGCNGGWPATCYDWTRDNNNMIARQSDYKYRALDGSCQRGKKSAISGMQMVGTEHIAFNNEWAMLTAVKDTNIGVLSVAIGVYGKFSSYKSGVYSSSSCSSVNHAVDVVGYGTLNGEYYWQVRNSWGSDWGDNGYIKMKRGVNTCAIAEYPYYPYLTGTPEFLEDDEVPDDEEKESDQTGTWKKLNGKRLNGRVADQGWVSETGFLERAKTKCTEIGDSCSGISCKKNGCLLHTTATTRNKSNFDSYLKPCSSGNTRCLDNTCKHVHMCAS